MLTERSTYPRSANNFSLVNGISEGTSKFLVWTWRVTAESQLLKPDDAAVPLSQGRNQERDERELVPVSYFKFTGLRSLCDS